VNLSELLTDHWPEGCLLSAGIS